MTDRTKDRPDGTTPGKFSSWIIVKRKNSRNSWPGLTRFLLAAGLAVALGVVALALWANTHSRIASPVGAPATPSGPLVGTSWRIEVIRGIEVPSGSDAVPVLEFPTADVVVGTDPCGNRVKGSYFISGKTLWFSNVGTTLIGCPPELNIATALEDTRQTEITGSRINLLDLAGAVLIQGTLTQGTPSVQTPPVTPAPSRASTSERVSPPVPPTTR